MAIPKDIQAALSGTAGDPSDTNRYVTDQDPRNADNRKALPHQHPTADVVGLDGQLGSLTTDVEVVKTDAAQMEADIAALKAAPPGLPAGELGQWPNGAAVPPNWLICDGRAVSRTDYKALFAVIDTTYGEGDGTSTFNLPNFTAPIYIIKS